MMKAEEKLKIAIVALEKISDPIEEFRRVGKEKGYSIDGHYAAELADNPAYLRIIAKESFRST
jgi:hypothetical protein